MPPPPLNMTAFNTTSERVPPMDPYRAHMEALEIAGKMVEKQMTMDSSFPQLTERMRISAQSKYSELSYYYRQELVAWSC
jgi:hypothetical protein